MTARAEGFEALLRERAYAEAKGKPTDDIDRAIERAETELTADDRIALGRRDRARVAAAAGAARQRAELDEPETATVDAPPENTRRTSRRTK